MDSNGKHIMNVWTVAEQDRPSDLALHALSGIIAHIGSHGFAGALLAQINQGMAAGSCSVYRTSASRMPVCYLSASHRRRDTTARCFLAYRNGLYREDRTFDAVPDSAGDPGVRIIHLNAAQVRNPEHRRMIYEHHRLGERLSAARRCADGSILSVNLYRHDDQPAYRDRDLQLFGHLAHGLFACVERQIALTAQAAGPVPAISLESRQAEEVLENALRRLSPDITARELEVSLRLLKGMSHDGIACDLGIGVTTVKTYRNRAFARLGIHHNNELFALVLQCRDRPAAA